MRIVARSYVCLRFQVLAVGDSGLPAFTVRMVLSFATIAVSMDYFAKATISNFTVRIGAVSLLPHDP